MIREGAVVIPRFLLGALLIAGGAQAEESGPTREQDAQCLAAVTHEVGRPTDGSSKDLVQAGQYYVGKVRARFPDAELPSALRAADLAMSKHPNRRGYAITCWQMFQLDMMVVTQAADSGRK